MGRAKDAIELYENVGAMASTTLTATALSERFALHRDPHPAQVATFAEDVRGGLAARPMRLSSKYFYDDLGSALFDAITQLPEYYLTRVERDLVAVYGHEIVAAFGAPIELVELGSGSMVRTRLLIDAIFARQPTLTYHPIDISADAVTESALALAGAYERLRVVAYASDYFPLLREKRLVTRDRVLALFLGSNIGNFEPADARALLRLLAGALRPGDGLLIGYDLKKDPSILELAYDDPTGVTAAFNKNLLARMNRELGANFDLSPFRFRARWNERHGAVGRSWSASARSGCRFPPRGSQSTSPSATRSTPSPRTSSPARRSASWPDAAASPSRPATPMQRGATRSACSWCSSRGGVDRQHRRLERRGFPPSRRGEPGCGTFPLRGRGARPGRDRHAAGIEPDRAQWRGDPLAAPRRGAGRGQERRLEL